MKLSKLWLWADGLLAMRGAVEPGLGRPHALPAGHVGGEIDLLPFRMAAGLQELVEAREERIHEAPDAVVAVRILRPVEHGKQAADRQGLDRLVLVDELRIVRIREARREVAFRDLALEGNGEKMEAALGLELGDGANRPSGHVDGGLDLAGLQLAHRRTPDRRWSSPA